MGNGIFILMMIYTKNIFIDEEKLDWSEWSDLFYFDKNTGEMFTRLHKLDWSKATKWFYLDKENDNMLTGLQTINDHGLRGIYYFDPKTGARVN